MESVVLDTDVVSYSTADAWVAATALHLAAPLVTNNQQDYLGLEGLEILTEPAK